MSTTVVTPPFETEREHTSVLHENDTTGNKPRNSNNNDHISDKHYPSRTQEKSLEKSTKIS